MRSLSTELVHRLIEAHNGFLGLWTGFERVQLDGATFITNRLLSGAFRNHVGLVNVEEGQADALLAACRAAFIKRQRTLVIQPDPTTRPASLAATLERQGFANLGDEAWMIYEPPTDGISVESRAAARLPDPNPRVRVEAFDKTNLAAARFYADSFNICFGVPPAEHESFYTAFVEALQHAEGFHYVGYLGDQPAGAMSLFYAEGLACVYNVSALPEFRGQRVATTILQRLLADSAALGQPTIFLQTLYQGRARPLYERHGFQTLFVRPRYSLT